MYIGLPFFVPILMILIVLKKTYCSKKCQKYFVSSLIMLHLCTFWTDYVLDKFNALFKTLITRGFEFTFVCYIAL